jgi:O-antigen biosynthesis protein
VVELECGDLPALRPAGSASSEQFEVSGHVLALVRLNGSPIGLVQAHVDDPAEALATLLGTARTELGEDIRQRLRRPPGPAGSRAGEPRISVVIATRERPTQLARCLESVARLRYRNHEVIVVDNAPQTDAAERLVRERFGHLARYVTEPRRGLAAAHNRGLTLAGGEIIAFTDDDVIVDEDWLTAVAAGFAAGADVGCVTGLIVPAELQTPAQVTLEAHGGFSKGFAKRRFSIGEPGADPLFPFTAGAFGSGANMAFSAALLRELGGFDPATGAGSLARGGDDLLAFFRTIVAGHILLYQPGAVVWHHHARSWEALEHQAYGYGVGLGAFLAAALTNEPQMVPAFLRRVPRGVIHALARSRSHPEHMSGWTRQLSWAQHRGLVYGPIAYARSRRAITGLGSP